MRGAITLAGVLTLPMALPDGSPFPARDLAVFLAAAVVLLSLLAASFGLPRLLRGLQVPAESDSQHEERRARQAATQAALAAVERARQSHVDAAPSDAQVYTDAASRVLALYRGRLERGDTDVDAQRLQKADEAERELRLAALRAERGEIFALARRGRLADDVARRIVREIDLVEARYQ